MLRSLLTILVAALLIFFVFPALVPHPENLSLPLIWLKDAPVSHLTVAGVFEETNKARLANSAYPAFAHDELLDKAATERLDNMFAEQYFEHYSPSGKGASDAAENAHYEYVMIGENIAMGNFENDLVLVDAWMNSPGHRANILKKDFSEIGIAVGQGTFKGKKTWIAVQVFAKPLSSCPKLDEGMKNTIEQYGKRIDAFRARLSQMPKNTQEEIDQYNIVVAEANKLINTHKDLIFKYNAQVNAFNLCIKE